MSQENNSIKPVSKNRGFRIDFALPDTFSVNTPRHNKHMASRGDRQE